MSPELLINLKEVNLQELGLKLLEQCPKNSTNMFSEGFYYFVCELFDSLDSSLLHFKIEEEIAILPLEIYLEEPLEYLPERTIHLNNTDKKEFLLGVDQAIEVCSNALYSSCLNYISKCA